MSRFVCGKESLGCLKVPLGCCEVALDCRRVPLGCCKVPRDCWGVALYKKKKCGCVMCDTPAFARLSAVHCLSLAILPMTHSVLPMLKNEFSFLVCVLGVSCNLCCHSPCRSLAALTLYKGSFFFVNFLLCGQSRLSCPASV